MLKRLVDFFIASLGLLLIMPSFLIVWLFVKLSGKGPAIISNERVGKNTKPIKIYRFNLSEDTQKSCTKNTSGNKNQKFIRFRHHLRLVKADTWPMLFNVLKGDLSLIGPKPEKPEFVKYYRRGQKQVFTVRPGIISPYEYEKDLHGNGRIRNGKSQKEYYRTQILPEKLKADLRYINEKGLGRDIRVLAHIIEYRIPKMIYSRLVNNAKSRNFMLPVDMVLIFVSYFLAYQLRFDWFVPAQEYAIFFKCFGVVLFLRILTFYYFGIYKNLWKYVGIKDLLSIIWACSVSSILLITIIFLVGNLDHSRSIFLIDWLLCISLISGARVSLRIFTEKNDFEPKVQDNVLIIGAGDVGEMLLRMLRMNGHRYNVVGFIDKDKGTHGLTIHGIKVLGNIDDIPHLTPIFRVDDVLIAEPELSSEEMKLILRSCREAGVRHRIVPAVNDLLSGSYHFSKFRNVEISDLFGRQPVQLDLSAIQKFLEDKKVLVTGAGGSIGSELCRQIVEYSPKTLFLLDKGENYLHEIRCELDGQFTSVQIRSNLCNITNSAKMTRIFEEYHPEIIFHAAAHKHVPLSEENPEEAIWNNVYGTKVLANLADEFGVREFVMISTDKAINPSSLMGVTKRIAELYIQALSQKKATKTKFVTVRFGNVLNSNGSVVPIFKNQIEKGGPITITHPDVSRYFMSIAEAAQLVLQAGTMGKSGEIFLLEMGKSIRILDLAIELINQAGLKPFEDIPVKIIGLRPGEKMHEELIGRDEVASPTSHVGIKILQSKQVVTLTEIEAKIAELINFDYSRGFNILTKKIIDLVSEYQPSNPQANPQIKADNVNKLEFEISHLNSSKNVAFSARGNNR